MNKKKAGTDRTGFVVVVEHRHGVDALGVFRTHAEAEEAIFGWVCDNWQEELTRAFDPDQYKPLAEYTKAEAIQAYFYDLVGDESALVLETAIYF